MNTPRNNPVINPDDPKWTAYVLGELDEAERAEIERLLETSEEARALVEDLTVATASMKEELTSLLPLMMTPEQRAAIRSAATPPQKRWFEVFPSRWGLGLAAAAIVVLAVALPVAVLDQFQEVPKAEEVAQEPTATSGKESADLPVPPQISIVRADQAKSMDKGVSAGPVAPKQQSGPAGNATAAPVLTQEEFARLAQDAPAVAASSTTATPAPVTSSIVGTVADAAGARIPGVTVSATNANTGVTQATVTNESGAYTIPSVLAGNYQVKAVLPGFQAQTVTNLPVGPQQTLRVNYTLQVASQSTQVEVQVAADTLLKAEAASVGQVLSQDRVADLPLVGNNVLDLVKAMPGVQDGRQGQQEAQLAQATRLQSVQQLQRTADEQGQQGQGQGGQSRPPLQTAANPAI